jgi:hypothetical protein
MNTDDHIPPEIGPHEGRELELLLAGKKPVAMFSDVIPQSFELPEKDFAPFVETGQLIRREVRFSPYKPGRLGLRFLFYALPEEEWRIGRLIEIHRAIHENGKSTTPGIETEIGRLLGYLDHEIQFFVERFFNRIRG